MAAAKIVSFLRSDRPGVLALVGPTGCGKRHAIAEAARQARVAIIHHDLAQGGIEWGRLGSQQLTPTGLARCTHVVSNASEQFLQDFAFAKKTQAKLILVADDASQSVRASGVPVVRMQAMSSDAMAKKLFLDLDWPAQEAVAAARHAKGDWHQLQACNRLCPDQIVGSQVCSEKDATIADAPPCFVANQLLNGTAPDGCPLDPSVVAWTESNLAVHCDSIENMAERLEAMAASTCVQAGDAIGEEIFRQAARLKTKRVHCQPGLYMNPNQKDERAVREIKESFERLRAKPASMIKKRALEEEVAAQCSELKGSRGATAKKARISSAKPKPRANAPSKAAAQR